MRVISFNGANCAHCYKCVRQCDVKAIKIENGQAQIVTDLCISCGYCVEICPQGAQTLESSLGQIKKLLESGEKVIASLDPAYIGLLEIDGPERIIGALLKLGFADVRDTAEGAVYVTREYSRLMKEKKMDNIITTQCPSLVYLVEKKYPMLVQYLAPVVSPMVAHAKMLKREYGEDVKVVYIGPCVAKKMEAEYDRRSEGLVEAVLELNEMIKWFEEENINLDEIEGRPFENHDPKVNRLYPIPYGIIRSVRTNMTEDNYKYISVDGVRSCRDLLHSMKNGNIHNAFVELNICEGGCVNGPGTDKEQGSRFRAQMRIENRAIFEMPDEGNFPEIEKEKMYVAYEARPVVEKKPSDEDIAEILKKLGRSDSDTEFNCGACGYRTCRENAIAIYHGRAETTMCLVRAYENAKSQANVFMNNTPQIVVILDKDMNIQEFNRSAELLMKERRMDVLGTSGYAILDCSDFEEVLNTHKNKIAIRRRWEQYSITVLETIVYVPQNDSILVIAEDYTEREMLEKEKKDSRKAAMIAAQQVIDKQMAAAQQIAGLLGETTAETKATLSLIRDMAKEAGSIDE